MHQLKEISEVSYYYPEDIIENNDTCEIIKKQGFKIFFKTNQSIEDIRTLLMENAFLNNVDINKFYSEIEFSEQFSEQFSKKNEKPQEDIIKSINNIVNDTNDNEKVASKSLSYKQSLISVDVNKLDKLMDLVGELVISEAMVTKNPEISELQLDSFNKAARQHRKGFLIFKMLLCQ